MTGVSYFLLALAAMLLADFRAKRRERAKFVAVFHGLRVRADADVGPLPSRSPVPIEFVKAGTQLCRHACDLGIQARALFDGNLVRHSIESERRLRGEQYRVAVP